MFTKLLTITIAFGIIGCALLVNRQQRIEAAHEMSVIHRRLNEHERTIWRMRADIARRCTPRQLQEAREVLAGTFVPYTEESIRPFPGLMTERRLADRDDDPSGEGNHRGSAEPDGEWGG